MFELLRIEYLENSKEMTLHLSRNNFIPEKFNSEDLERDELKLIGISNPKKLYRKLNEFLNNYIDIEKLENGRLDFWSDQIQIGEFEIESFQEKTNKFNKTDWIESYQYLLNEYLKRREISIREKKTNKEFIDKLEKFIEQDRNKNIQKSDFYKNKPLKLNSIKEKNNLIDRLDNMKNQYLTELRKI